MQTTVADETEIGGRCKRDARVVERGPGKRVMGKAWRLQCSRRSSRNVHVWKVNTPADRLVPEPLLNASLSPYDPSCRLPGTDKPRLTRCGGGTHRIVPRLGKRLATDRGRRQRRLRHQGLPGERRAIHEPQLQARHSHRNDRGGFSYIAGQSLYETPSFAHLRT